MKIQFFLCVFSLAASVLGSSAGVYQVVYFWYAYQLELLANPTTKIIAPECIGSAPGGACYFDEFARYIQSSGKGTTPWPINAASGIGTNMSPDPTTAAKALEANGYRATTKYQALCTLLV